MENSNKTSKNKKTRSNKRYENEGLTRVEIDIDYQTYTLLLKLIEKSGYQLDSDASKRQRPSTKEGFKGVITQGIVELYLKYEAKGSLNGDLGLNKKCQQKYIFRNRITAMEKIGMSKAEIISTIKPKFPDYLKIDNKANITIKIPKDEVGLEFPDIGKPKVSDAMKKDFEKAGITKFVSSKKYVKS